VLLHEQLQALLVCGGRQGGHEGSLQVLQQQFSKQQQAQLCL
jgi:hypothetical protein